MRFLLVLPLLVTPALADECRQFRHETDPEVTLEDRETALIVDDHGERTMYPVGISKVFGQLTSMAIEDKKSEGTPYRYLDLNGKRVVIYKAAVFYPDCK